MFRVKNNIQLSKLSTYYTSELSIEEAQKKRKKCVKKISKLQEKLAASQSHSILICIQGMDTSGKDSLIRKVIGPLNPSGVNVHSFKRPTELELSHDYLWRHQLKLPAKGEITVFNRTHYENVLVTRVHPQLIVNLGLPQVKSVQDVDDSFWQNRMDQINDWEKHLVENGTIVLKFFLHISKDVQKQRLKDRLIEADKNWKFEEGDLKERKRWDDYQKVYQEAINSTSTDEAPWFVIPADSKPHARLIVSQIILDELKKLELSFPTPEEGMEQKIPEYLKALANG